MEVSAVSQFTAFHSEPPSCSYGLWWSSMRLTCVTASLNVPEEVIEDAEKTVTTRYTPLGVVGAICPWNCE